MFPFHLSSSPLCCRDPEEFNRKLEHALSHDPQPMTADQRKRLTWEDATERFLDIAELKAEERPGVLEAAVDKLAWAAHNTLTGGQQTGAFWESGRGCWLTSVGLTCRLLAWAVHNMLTFRIADGRSLSVEELLGVAAG